MPAWTRTIALLLAPLLVAGGGLLLWRTHGFDSLNAWELPLMRAMNGIVGYSVALDRIIVFFNRWPGEALCVVLMTTIYALIARRLMGEAADWRRIACFGGFTFIMWLGANQIGNKLDNVFERRSPSLVMGEAHRDLDLKYGVKVKTGSSQSFPSNHGSVFLMVFFMMAHRWGPRRPVLLLVLPAAIVLSSPRVFGGGHWMTDTLIGSAIITWAVAAFVMCTPVFSRLYLPLETLACDLMDRLPGARPVGPPVDAQA